MGITVLLASGHICRTWEAYGHAWVDRRFLKMRRKIAVAVSTSYVTLIVAVILCAAWQTVTPQFALLAMVAITALYFGFGVLIAVYRFIARLE